MHRLITIILAVSFVLACRSGFARPTPLGSAINYQGQLKQGGTPYGGTADFTFKLFDSSGGPTQIGSTLAATNVTVDTGVFTVSLDFGALAFDGNERWLEIAVHTPSNGGIGPFTTLAPRQKLAAVPYALYALNALIAGTQANAVNFTNPTNTYSGSSMSLDGGTFHVDAVNNRVGIGTTTPASGAALDVRGGSVQNTPNATYGGFQLMQGSSTAALLGLDGSDVWVANTVAGSLKFSTFTSPNLISDRFRLYPNGRIRMGPTNSAPEPTSWVHIIAGFAGVPMNPNSSLALEKNASNYLNILAPDNGETGILFGKPTGGAEAGGVIYNNAVTPDGLQFRTGGNNTRASIDNTGRMLLSSSQSGPSLLGLNNTLDQPSGMTLSTNFRTWFVGQNKPADNPGLLDAFYVTDSSAGATRLLIDTSGNVGVGTTTPEQKLSVSGGLNIDQANANNGDLTNALRFGSGSGEAIASRRQAGTNQFGLNFYTNSLLQMTIANSGWVGIGTSTPQYTLHVKGGAGIMVEDNGANSGVGIRSASAVIGGMTISGSNLIVSDANNGALVFANSPGGATPLTERMRITNDGKVAIATTNPTGFVLAVNGPCANPFGTWSVFSDARLKTDIQPLPQGTLERLLQLRGRNFEYTRDAIEDRMMLPGVQTGFIAQEVEQVFPEWVSEDKEGYKFITERGTTALMVEALRELRAEKDAQIEALRRQHDAEMAQLHDRLAALETLVRSLEPKNVP